MAVEVSKVFKPPKKVKYYYAWSFFGFLLVVGAGFLDGAVHNGILVVVAIIFFVIFGMLSSSDDEIALTSQSVTIRNNEALQAIPLSKIRIVKVDYDGNNDIFLRIETNEANFYLGNGLTDAQIKEAAANILEQIRINYPVNYHDVKTEHFKVEKFWRK